jgi:ribosome biogenesis GTPase / thiamine phosphate phosphatase
MREFGILGAENGMSGSFSDIIGFASGCRYRNCSHTGEPGCAVLEAVNSGALSQEHFDNYIKLGQESDFHQMSHVEKRKKDRDFGKYIKSVKKDLKNK